MNRRYPSLLLCVVSLGVLPAMAAIAQTANPSDAIEITRKPVSEIPPQYRSEAPKPRKPYAARYTCPESGRLYVVFDNAEQTATLEMGQTTRYLKQGISASGARYVNSDESYVFWIKGKKASINGNEVCEAD